MGKGNEVAGLIRSFEEKRNILRVVELCLDGESVQIVIESIDGCIGVFNDLKEYIGDSSLKMNDLPNSQNLKLLRGVLPTYIEVFNTMLASNDLREDVLGELSTSSYFSDIWKIESDEDFLVNIMILFYRTTMLHVYPELREGDAQISSSIEECSVLVREKGKDNIVFGASRIWFENFEEEGFSRTLYETAKKWFV